MTEIETKLVQLLQAQNKQMSLLNLTLSEQVQDVTEQHESYNKFLVTQLENLNKRIDDLMT